VKCERIPRGHPKHFASSDALCEYVSSFSDTVLLGFSTGKDSLSAWLQCRRYFKRVVPFYLYFVPNLAFIDDSLRYYEDFFGVRVARYPDPGLMNVIDQLIYQPPEQCAVMEGAPIHRNLTKEDIFKDLRTKHDCKHALAADGTKMSDSLRRALSMKTFGVLYPHMDKFFAVYDWKDPDMEREIRAAGLQLPVDYQLFQRTWEGARYAQMVPMKAHLPEDYAQMLRWMPLSEAELWRRQFYEAEDLETY
jgi:hypothetical protein